MKKWIAGVCLILLLLLISTYLFIPGKVIVRSSVNANANQTGVHRFLSNDSNWAKWWPGSSFLQDNGQKVFESNGYRFKKNKLLYNAFEIVIEKDNHTENSLLNIFSIGNDSIKIEWNTQINTGINPFSRITRYFNARKLSNSLDIALAIMKNYIIDVKHIYGIDIRKEKVQVEFLVSTKKSFSHYPRTENIYEMVTHIKEYIHNQKAKEDDYPMLNVNRSDSMNFETQVAIPVDRQLPDTGIFASKKMLKFGNILVTEITGGKNISDSAMRQIEQYVSDYQYSNIALPFQSLVTDRTKVTDTTKWISKIYYPIR